MLVEIQPVLKAAEATPSSPPLEEAFSPELGMEAASQPKERGTEAEEILVIDARAHLTPAQAVERKLVSLLEGRPLPFSQRLRGACPRHPGH